VGSFRTFTAGSGGAKFLLRASFAIIALMYSWEFVSCQENYHRRKRNFVAHEPCSLSESESESELLSESMGAGALGRTPGAGTSALGSGNDIRTVERNGKTNQKKTKTASGQNLAAK
jgi:hypothetical protein